MAAEKSLAIVLRVVDFSESSCVVTLFTRELGKISGLAKGARRPKSPFEAALDLLALVRLVFLHKSSGALDILTEARLERRFRAAASDLSSLYAAYYVIELLDALTDEADPHPELFDAADEALQALNGAGCDVAAEVLRFEMQLLRRLGHAPQLDACVECGSPLAEEPRVLFGQLAGGVVCANCRVGMKQVVNVRREVIKTLARYAEDTSAWRQAPLEAGIRGELRGLVNQYLANLLGRRPRMYGYLGMLAH